MTEKPRRKTVTVDVDPDVWATLTEIAKQRREPVKDTAASMLAELVRDCADG